jgi:hypothetical protein
MQQFPNLFTMLKKSKSFTRKDAFGGSRKDINAVIDKVCEFTENK